MNINTLAVYKELDESIKFIETLKPGIYEFRQKYIVLKEFSTQTKNKVITIHPKGAERLFKSSEARAYGSNVKLKPGDNTRSEGIRKMKQYLDFKCGQNSGLLRDVEFMDNFNKFRVF